jgi:hypothetical protein
MLALRILQVGMFVALFAIMYDYREFLWAINESIGAWPLPTPPRLRAVKQPSQDCAGSETAKLSTHIRVIASSTITGTKGGQFNAPEVVLGPPQPRFCSR